MILCQEEVGEKSFPGAEGAGRIKEESPV